MTEEKPKGMTYAGVGVDYNAMDPFKRMCQLAGRATASRLGLHGMSEVEESRGESAYLIDTGSHYLAHVEEGLGTKNLVADVMYRLTGKSYYDQVAQDTVAMIVNDMATLGARPLSVAMHLAAGASEWFEDEKRCRDLVEGWARACVMAQCAWGGGETPTLKGMIVSETVVLSGSAVGIISPKSRRIMGRPEVGDRIILLEHNGIGANGLTLARRIAENLPEGYLTKLPSGRSYGEVLLDPTPIVASIISDLLTAGVRLHAAINVTGHGWRKLMRSPDPLAYVIYNMPRRPEIFDFMRTHGPLAVREAYGNLNMGALFALMMPKDDVDTAFGVLNAQDSDQPHTAVNAGIVDESQERFVSILPEYIIFRADELQVR